MSCVKQSGEPASGLPGADPAFNAFAAMQPRPPEPTIPRRAFRVTSR